MASLALSPRGAHEPPLRPAPAPRRRDARAAEPQGRPGSVERQSGAVLVAGTDAHLRTAVVEELADSLPEGTSFQEASAMWELMARAPESRLVVFSGQLDDLTPESLLHTLAHRHPGLPVVSLEAPGRAAA